MFNPQEHWNKSHLGHSQDRQPSNYAKDKEASFPLNSIICDLGGGDGTDSLYFMEKGHQVYLFDIADQALKVAEGKARSKGLENKLTTKILDLGKNDISTNDSFFDIVYARLSLHYFYPTRTVEILKDINRVLKPSGTAYIAIKSPDDKDEMKWLESNNEKLEEGIYSEDGLIKTRYTKNQYRNFLEKAGIKNFVISDYTENFGEQKVYVKSKADKLMYIEIVFRKD